MGVRAVIAAGWAVDDAAAKLFAQIFYERLLDGNSFGDSVSAARVACYEHEQNRNSNTWGAYQCYGDPDFSLRVRKGGNSSDPDESPLSPADFKQKLEAITREAGYGTNVKKERELTDQLEQLIHIAPSEWFDLGSVSSAVAKAFAELGNFEKAAQYYQKANVSAHGDASIASLQQLVNMKARLAVELACCEDAKEHTDRVVNELAEAARIINSLIVINGSQERYALKGSVHKCQAKLATEKTQQREHLRQMQEAYSEAHRIGVETKQANAYYPLQNAVAARIAVGWSTTTKNRSDRDGIKEGLDQLEGYLEATDMRDADFWTACQEPDLFLLKALGNNPILSKAELPDILDSYMKARKRGGTEREWKSIGGHIEFFLTVAALQLSDNKKKENLTCALNHLLKELTGKQEDS